MTPNGISNAAALHSVAPEPFFFLFFSLCLLFDHFSCSCLSGPLLFLAAFSVADCDHPPALLLTLEITKLIRKVHRVRACDGEPGVSLLSVASLWI